MKKKSYCPLFNSGSNGIMLTAATLLLSAGLANAQTVMPFKASGTFTVPDGVTDLTVECWGAGGGGGGTSPNPSKGGGGGGGAYVSSALAVNPGESYVITVGVGGTRGNATGVDGGNGGNSSFGGNVVAEGGKGATSGNTTNPIGSGGLGGNINNSQGNIKFSGGNGANAQTTRSGGGGGSAGISNDGSNASPTSTGGGAAVTGGGSGAAGQSTSAAGIVGGFPGGGGGGGFKATSSSRTGGTGGAGLVKLSYTCPAATLPYSPSISNGQPSSIPACTAIEDANNDGNTWVIDSDPAYAAQGFTGNILMYQYNPSLATAANDWFYTQALHLLGNSTYTLSFNYSNDGTSTDPENLNIYYGTTSQSSAMTNNIATMSNIITANNTFIGSMQAASYTFTPATTGVYYVGFKASSTTAGRLLVLGNITVDGSNVPLATSVGKLTGTAGKDGHAFLSWNTYSAVNAKGFTISRSEDGKHFYDAGFVASKVTGSEGSNSIAYNFYDHQAMQQKTYYRIFFTDENQKNVYSNVVELLPQAENGMNLTAFPNPAKDNLKVSVAGNAGNHAFLLLTDITGKVILQQQMEGASAEIDMHHLPKGMYLLKYQDDNSLSVQKINKQ